MSQTQGHCRSSGARYDCTIRSIFTYPDDGPVSQMEQFEKEHPLQEPAPAALPDEVVRMTSPDNVAKKGEKFELDEVGCELHLTCFAYLAQRHQANIVGNRRCEDSRYTVCSTKLTQVCGCGLDTVSAVVAAPSLTGQLVDVHGQHLFPNYITGLVHSSLLEHIIQNATQF